MHDKDMLDDAEVILRNLGEENSQAKNNDALTKTAAVDIEQHNVRQHETKDHNDKAPISRLWLLIGSSHDCF